MPKILIIEDDNFLSNVYRSRLNTVGVESQIINTGIDVLKKTNEYNPDLIILDLIMPKVSGVEVLKKIKSDPMHKDLPVVIITQDSSDDGKEKCLKLGATQYIVKTDQNFDDVITLLKPLLKVS